MNITPAHSEVTVIRFLEIYAFTETRTASNKTIKYPYSEIFCVLLIVSVPLLFCV